MGHISEAEIIESVTYSDDVPVPKRGRAANSPWARLVDPLIAEFREKGKSRTATVHVSTTSPAQQQQLEHTVNRIRALGQTSSRKDISIHVIRNVVDGGNQTDVSIYITAKVKGGRPRKDKTAEETPTEE